MAGPLAADQQQLAHPTGSSRTRRTTPLPLTGVFPGRIRRWWQSAGRFRADGKPCAARNRWESASGTRFRGSGVVLGQLQVQRWQCKACGGSASPLPPGVTARQRSQAFRELVTAMYVYSVSSGVWCASWTCGAAGWCGHPGRDVQAVAPGLAPDPQAKLPPWVEVDETWLSLGAQSVPWPWSWAPRANGWTCA